MSKGARGKGGGGKPPGVGAELRPPERGAKGGGLEPGSEDGLVAAVYSGKFRVLKEGVEWVCTLRGSRWREAPPVVGDRVAFALQPDGTGTILALHPRSSTLIRRQAHRGRRTRPQPPQVLAANVEQLVIVAALKEPPFSAGLVERFLVAAAVAGIDPLLCISKTDLDQGGEFQALAATYQGLDLPVLGTELKRPETLTPLTEALAGKMSVLVGHSGVGKTSLLNALVDRKMAVGELGGQQGARGRHTTSTARLIPLIGGGYAIDSPGVREFGLHGPAPEELARHYPDFQPYLGLCGFRDCMHRGEPKCAVLEAVETGRLSQARYQSYRTLLEDLEGE